MKRAVWYFAAVLPPRVRHGLPAGRLAFRARMALDRVGGLLRGQLHPRILAEHPVTTQEL